MPVSFSELEWAFEFVSSGGMGENEAYLDRQSGKIYCRSEMLGDDVFEPLPDDLDDDRYIEIPHKKELDLGKPLVMAFVAEFLPGEMEEVREIFRKRGAYGRFKGRWCERGRSSGGTTSRTKPNEPHCAAGARRTRSS